MRVCKCQLLPNEGNRSIPTLVPTSIIRSSYMSEFHVRVGTASFMLSEQLHLLKLVKRLEPCLQIQQVFRVKNLLLRVSTYAHIGVVQ